MEPLKTDLTAVRKQVSGQANVQFEFRDAQDAFSWFKALSGSAREHTRATGRHFAQVNQKLTVAQGKLAPIKSR